MKKFIFFIRWKEQSKYDSKRIIDFGKLLKVNADNITEAIAKIHEWAKDTKYHHATIESQEEYKNIEVIS